MRHEELAEAILLSPALQRLHAVFRHDRLPVVPSQAVAQRERVLHAVRRHGGPIDHLRLDLKVLVRAEQGVVHEIAVVARDVGGRPDRIEDLQIGLRHEAKGLPALLGVDRRRAQRDGGGRARASDDLSATDAVHPRRVPRYRAERGACSPVTSIACRRMPDRSLRQTLIGGAATTSHLLGCLQLAHRDKSQSPEFTVGIDAKRTVVDKRSRPNL